MRDDDFLLAAWDSAYEFIKEDEGYCSATQTEKTQMLIDLMKVLSVNYQNDYLSDISGSL